MNLDADDLTTEADYDRALREIGHYFAAEPKLGSPDAARFDTLAAAIEV